LSSADWRADWRGRVEEGEEGKEEGISIIILIMGLINSRDQREQLTKIEKKMVQAMAERAQKANVTLKTFNTFILKFPKIDASFEAVREVFNKAGTYVTIHPSAREGLPFRIDRLLISIDKHTIVRATLRIHVICGIRIGDLVHNITTRI
jgi:hypothetical protein